MLIAIYTWLKNFFSGVFIEQDLEDYINSHDPKSIEEVEQLQRNYWSQRIRGREF